MAELVSRQQINIKKLQRYLRTQINEEKLCKMVCKLPARQQHVVRERLIFGRAFKCIAADADANYDTTKANYRHGMITLAKGIGYDSMETESDVHQPAETRTLSDQAGSQNPVSHCSGSMEG